MQETQNNKSHNFDPKILRAYDIRGTYGDNLTEEDAYYLGRCFAAYMDANNVTGKVSVGYDGRLSSPQLSEALIKGLNASGRDVINIGLVPTPALYFATNYFESSTSGIMVTGSHNPPEHNGFKMVMDGKSIYGDLIKEMVAATSFTDGAGVVEKIDIKADYVAKLMESALGETSSELRVAWDPGNGSAGGITQMLAERLPGEHLLINDKIDGTFPAHHPDPTVAANLEQIIDVVKSEKCDMGIAFDGDGDRIGAVDDKGRIIWGDQLLMIYAQELLERKPGSSIIADVKTSKITFDMIKQWGGNAIMWKTGHSLIKAKMKEEDALLAGEMSGHIFFKDEYYGFDDALFGACRLIKIIANSGKKLSEIIDGFPNSISTPEIRIDVAEERKFDLIDEIAQHLNDTDVEFSDIDGVRVNKDEGWWLLRASNTQSSIAARVEGNSHQDVETLAEELSDCLAVVGIDLSVPEIIKDV